MERTLYRLSISDYREKFTLKGGIFLYALYDGDYPKLFADMDSIGLEAAIDNNALSENAKDRIRTLTWKCINETDLKLFRDKNLEDRLNRENLLLMQ